MVIIISLLTLKEVQVLTLTNHRKMTKEHIQKFNEYDLKDQIEQQRLVLDSIVDGLQAQKEAGFSYDPDGLFYAWQRYMDLLGKRSEQRIEEFQKKRSEVAV